MSQHEKQYTIHQFTAAEVEQYTRMRLEALQLEPGMFGNSYAYEAAFPPEQWVARISNPAGACFGLYAGEELIGITGIVSTGDCGTGEAEMTQSYIREAYRGKGLSRILYEARIDWARSHDIHTLKIGHRQSNIRSRAANQHYGFLFTHAVARTWPDGHSEDMVYYELKL